jgi:hypothetical protein
MTDLESQAMPGGAALRIDAFDGFTDISVCYCVATVRYQHGVLVSRGYAPLRKSYSCVALHF